MMETTESLFPTDGMKLATIPTTEDEKVLDETNLETDLHESNSSDGEEKEQPLTIANPDDEKQIKEKIDMQQDDTTQETGENEANHPDIIAEDNTIENDTRSTTIQHEFVEEEKDKVEVDINHIESQIPKLNGNHSQSIHDDYEDSSSSSTSSDSSHNLVIDHPLAEEAPPIKFATTEDSGTIEKKIEEKSLKRKLSSSEIGSPQYKQIHLDIVSDSPQREPEVHVADVDNTEAIPEVVPKLETNKNVNPEDVANNTWQINAVPILPKEVAALTMVPSSSPYEQYASSSNISLPAPKLSFDCFKCKNAVFDTFTELRDHHKVCLFKENRRKLPKTPTVTPTCESLSKEKCPAASTQPSEPPPTPTKKRFYLCSSCGTYHENWNLFLHIREIHNRHVCLYCIRLFPTAEKLSLHLEIKHDLEQNHFNSEERLRSVSKGDGNSRFLMCCTCQHVFSEHERFSDHVCTEYMQPCSLCSQKGRHLNNCKANPEKRPKVKKKIKTSAPATVTKSSIQPHRSTSATSITLTTPASVCDSKFNNNQKVLSTLPLSLQTVTPHLPHEFSKQNGFSDPPAVGHITNEPIAECNYNSDDSTNMVIDETCTSNNYINEMAGVNPFKALDERERLQEEVQKTAETKTTLPPDIVPETIPEPKPLIVPKIKLRVPKEFQKAVESEISSTDSDDDEEDEDAENEQAEEEEDETKQPNSVIPLENNINADDGSDDNDVCSNDDKDNTEDWDESNSNLDRILKEIEKTKLDIQRTKEMLEPMHNLKKVPSEIELSISPRPASCSMELVEEPPYSRELVEEPRELVEEPPYSGDLVEEPSYSRELVEDPQCSMESVEDPSCSIDSVEDPPCSMESVEEPPCSLEPVEWEQPINSMNSMEDKEPWVPDIWTTPEHGMLSPTPPPTPNSVWPSPLYMSEVSPAVLQAVSERENIENMEKESEHAKEQTSESDKMDTSGELDVESVHTLEESTMDVEEKIKSCKNSAMEVTQNSSPPSQPDFVPISGSELINSNEIAEEPLPVVEPEMEEDADADEEIEVVNVPPADGINVASEDVRVTELLLDRPIEKFTVVEFVRLCVKAVYSMCLYCNHARRIAVNGHSLVLHLLSEHRFAAIVDSITAEELLPSTIVSKLKSFLPELEEHYFNLESYCSVPPKENFTITCDERQFECFQCRFSTKMHKDLYLHNRKMHLKTAILCFMCRANFFSFSEILCHICPGLSNKVTVFDIKFRCCLCDVDGIPSPFRLMVHLRKKHFACDICLEDCREQSRLSSHVWKHKLHHLCYRCGIAYRNKMDITKHLYWKHGTESIICKRCLQKRWRHVYHFCVPPPSFVCESCNLCFSKATYLKVHKRIHTGDFRYPCTEDNCEEKFISRKLLLKHSATHAPPEIKVEEKIESEVAAEPLQDDSVKVEETPKEEKTVPETADHNEEVVKVEEKKVEKSSEPTSKRKKKKNRNKESLEDLNLIAPNLSESDSSEESDTDKPKTDDADSMVPNVMLSPPSEEDKDEEKVSNKLLDKDAGKIMDIWENFKSFQASQQPKQEEDDNVSLSESNYPTPILHVTCSDHDYSAMYKVRPRVAFEEAKVDVPAEPEHVDLASDTERDGQNVSMRDKSISPSKKKRKSTGSGSSSSDSSSGSDSSCSCGSNCSCSSSGSSSNSSSSSDDSDSSTSAGRRRIAVKKQERADRNRLKSETSVKASNSENVDVIVEDTEPIIVADVKENLEPVLIETDLETAESETDEEFYDEHPQKLASEMLAQKRQQLQAQMRLSPSHNFDIMENSRPSTPSIPEEMVKEKKVKLKKKKRDRKSTSKSQAVPPIKLNLSVNKVEISNKEPTVHQTSMQVPEVDLVPPYDLIASPGVAEPPVAHQPPSTPILQNNIMKPVPFFHSRMSEGSSCSDADNSLKRSKRARRPNKFYGYTSDDENAQGTPLMIGTRTFKPQPPPQLTWRKEDLPAPSKSILLNKQPRSPRTPKTPAGTSNQVKKRVHQKSSAKKKQHRLPPIPTLKIRPSKIGIVPPLTTAAAPPPPPIPANHTYSSSRDDSDDSDSSDDDLELPASNTLIPPAISSWNPISAAIIPAPPVPVVSYTEPPPPPQASAFNQKIPPALLPNPDLATIQYFKRNNIRYPIRPPAGARQPREGESVYCYCRCPYDEVSEMIACDGENCLIEWFHFECVGIMVAPQGKWFCAECRPKYSNELYPKL